MDTSPPVYLRIANKFLCPLTDPKNGNQHKLNRAGPPNQRAEGHLVAIQAPLNTLRPYTNEVSWLWDIADTLFKTNGRPNELYKLNIQKKPNYTEVWLANRLEDSPTEWKLCQRNDGLEEGIYEFRPKNLQDEVILTRMYPKDDVKWPLPGPAVGTAFTDLISLRENYNCVVSGVGRLTTGSCVASHLTPRRLGHLPTKWILESDGVQYNANWGNANESYRVGILLFHPIDKLVDSFQAGFYTPTAGVSTTLQRMIRVSG